MESGKSIMKLEGKSGKIISMGCFPPKFANSGTLSTFLSAADIGGRLSCHQSHDRLLVPQAEYQIV